ncbi:hypothetical protein EEW87_001980 [Janibacter melonis]|uniref:Uncharacterized protein n=1 Tax=Janibacter melonis TaxID=262209 RepID=A0A5P8FIN0_9MICO|nr:hypothetical protein [Janibacter melonis]QFQ29357.1 hypothetical protein EEW87_001980 [Janibacter melonis]
MDAAEAVTDRLAFLDAQTQPPGAAPALIVTGPPQPDDGWCLREALLAVMCPPLLTRGSRVLRSTTASLAHRLAQACQARQLRVLECPLSNEQVAALPQAWSLRQDLNGQIDALMAATT